LDASVALIKHLSKPWERQSTVGIRQYTLHEAGRGIEGMMEIRDASQADAAGILQIYNDAVVHTTAIWNDQPSNLESRITWLNERQRSGYLVVVAADGSNVLGYASFGAFRPWDGYRHTVEHSVYVDSSSRKLGIGHALMDELISRAR
jgi:L-amino acid N-acyltransferase